MCVMKIKRETHTQSKGQLTDISVVRVHTFSPSRPALYLALVTQFSFIGVPISLSPKEKIT